MRLFYEFEAHQPSTHTLELWNSSNTEVDSRRAQGWRLRELGWLGRRFGANRILAAGPEWS